MREVAYTVTLTRKRALASVSGLLVIFPLALCSAMPARLRFAVISRGAVPVTLNKVLSKSAAGKLSSVSAS